MMHIEKPWPRRRCSSKSAYPRDHIINRVFDVVQGHVGSAEEMCRRAGIWPDTLSAARRGDSNPRLLNIEAVLNLCGYELTIKKRRDISEEDK